MSYLREDPVSQNTGWRRAPRWYPWLDGYWFLKWCASSLVHTLAFRWRQQKFKHLVGGLPAVLTVGSTLALVFAVQALPPAQLRGRYEDQGQRALEEQQYEVARICYERLVEQNGGLQAHVYGLAVSLQGLGQTERAAVLWKQLAPEQGPGYPPAHLRHALELLNSPKPSIDTLQVAERHLLRAIQGGPETLKAHALLGQLYLVTGRGELATEHLLKAVNAHPSVALVLATLYDGRGDKETARYWAERVANYFRREADASPEDSSARLAWAQALLVVKDYRGALAVLERGWALSPTDAYREALARVYGLWADTLAGDPQADAAQRWTVIERGLRFDARNEALLRQLVELSQLHGPAAEQAQTQLSSLLAQGQNSATLHFCLGANACRRGLLDVAREHFDWAFRLDPQMPAVANNLAWVLAHNPPVDCARALEIIEALLQRYPQEPHYRETRGQILVKMGRWREAVPDLEYALPLLPGKQAIHVALAEAYEHLGLGELATEHRRLAADKPAND